MYTVLSIHDHGASASYGSLSHSHIQSPPSRSGLAELFVRDLTFLVLFRFQYIPKTRRHRQRVFRHDTEARMREVLRLTSRAEAVDRPEKAEPTAPVAWHAERENAPMHRGKRRDGNRAAPFSRRPRMPCRPRRSRSTPAPADRSQAAARDASRHSPRSRHARFRAWHCARCPQARSRGGRGRNPSRPGMPCGQPSARPARAISVARRFQSWRPRDEIEATNAGPPQSIRSSSRALP